MGESGFPPDYESHKSEGIYGTPPELWVLDMYQFIVLHF